MARHLENEDDLPPNSSPEERSALRRTRNVAWWLDDAIPVPGTNYRIGVDPIIGLLPVTGDVITGVVGSYIVAEAALIGAPPAIIGRMIANILVDVAIGSIPVIGDLFDAVWKANVRNVELLEDHIRNRH